MSRHRCKAPGCRRPRAPLHRLCRPCWIDEQRTPRITSQTAARHIAATLGEHDFDDEPDTDTHPCP